MVFGSCLWLFEYNYADLGLTIMLYLKPPSHTIYEILFCRSPLVGFLRFLHLLYSTDWHSTPVVLNFNNEISGK